MKLDEYRSELTWLLSVLTDYRSSPNETERQSNLTRVEKAWKRVVSIEPLKRLKERDAIIRDRLLSQAAEILNAQPVA